LFGFDVISLIDQPASGKQQQAWGANTHLQQAAINTLA
jgi:hypothetical protein